MTTTRVLSSTPRALEFAEKPAELTVEVGDASVVRVAGELDVAGPSRAFVEVPPGLEQPEVGRVTRASSPTVGPAPGPGGRYG